ncbi:hypothetical protein JB92DRAFT_3121574 [Gautieria morchelliformis]|nr:hypothetical protein JB92DRAFT_3121574 [Gautieria morchelliformis]
MTSQSSFDKEAFQTPVVPIPAALNVEDEGQIRARLGRYGLGKLFDFGVEARGIERVPENERQDKHVAGLMLFWFSVTTVLTNLSVGMLAQQHFKLTFPDTVGVVIGFGIIGCTTIAFTAMLGPRFGMRTMVITRYAFGYWGATAASLFNILTTVRSQSPDSVISSPIIALFFSAIRAALHGAINNLNHRCKFHPFRVESWDSLSSW